MEITFGNALFAHPLFNAADHQRKDNVLMNGQVWIQRVVFEDHCNVARRRRQSRNRTIIEEYVAGADRLDAGDHLERGALTATRWSEQRQHLPVRAVKREFANGIYFACYRFHTDESRMDAIVTFSRIDRKPPSRKRSTRYH